MKSINYRNIECIFYFRGKRFPASPGSVLLFFYYCLYFLLTKIKRTISVFHQISKYNKRPVLWLRFVILIASFIVRPLFSALFLSLYFSLSLALFPSLSLLSLSLSLSLF